MARKPPLLNLQKNERPSLGRNPFWKESSMAKLQDLEARAALEILEIQGMTPGIFMLTLYTILERETLRLM